MVRLTSGDDTMTGRSGTDLVIAQWTGNGQTDQWR